MTMKREMKREVDPTRLEGNGNLRALRGGGWFYDARGCRASFRGGNMASVRYGNLGFRPILRTLRIKSNEEG
jgi:formylglycine-generating enzyme required for sulfatase activity